MNNIIDFEGYKKYKFDSENAYKFWYDSLFEHVEVNIAVLKDKFNQANTKDEFNNMFSHLVYQLLCKYLSIYSKDEILSVIENGNIFAFERMLTEILATHPVLKEMYFRLKK
jgi:hypothetical protein